MIAVNIVRDADDVSIATLRTLALFPCRDPWPETGAVQGEWDDGQYRGEGSRALGQGQEQQREPKRKQEQEQEEQEQEQEEQDWRWTSGPETKINVRKPKRNPTYG